MKNIKLISIILLQILSFSVFSQSKLSSLSGTIVDKISKSQISTATIVIKADSSIYSGKSDENGRFIIKNIAPNRYEVVITYLGYNKMTIPNLLITSGKEEVLDIELEEKVAQVKEVVIKGRKKEMQNEMSTVSSRSFSMEEVNRYSGGRGDPARLAANFAGVSAPNDQRNDLVIRGNSPQGVLWRFEGINVPNLNHFSTLSTTGGPVSALNTNVLRNSDFMTSAFPSEYGNALAGVFDLGMRRGNINQREYTIQVSAFTGLEAMAEGPINKEKGSSYLIAYRYSFAGFAKLVGLNIGTAATPNYQDITFKINGSKTKAGQLSFFGIGAMSNINFLHNEIDSSDIFANPNRDSYVKSKIGVVGISHLISLSAKTNLKSIIGLTYTGNDYSEDSIEKSNGNPYKNLLVENSEIHYVFNSTLSSKINSKLSFKAGIISEIYNLNLLTRTRQLRPDWENRVDFNGNASLIQNFAQAKYNFNENLSMVAGIHSQFFSLNNSFAVEPRISFKYNNAELGAFTLGYGMHHQIQPLAVYFYQRLNPDNTLNNENRNLGFSRSHHLALGYEYWIKSEWKIKAEAYLQFLENIAVEKKLSSFSLLNEGASFAPTQKVNLVNSGTGLNRGIELTIEKYFTKGYYTLITTSLYKSTYEGSDKIERNTAFNGGYTLNILGGKEIKVGKEKRNALTFDTKFTLAGGRYYTPIDLAASRIAKEEIHEGDAKAFSQQNPDYMRFDIKFGYRINGKTKKIAHLISFDFQNITFRKNVFAERYNVVTQNVNTSYQNGFFPNFTYKLQF
jgi:Carboxypeptidase regulatory-like domain